MRIIFFRIRSIGCWLVLGESVTKEAKESQEVWNLIFVVVEIFTLIFGSSYKLFHLVFSAGETILIKNFDCNTHTVQFAQKITRSFPSSGLSLWKSPEIRHGLAINSGEKRSEHVGEDLDPPSIINQS